MATITDSLGRSFRTLRVSLTDACNLACLYCVPEGKEKKVCEGKRILHLEEYLSIIQQIHDVTPLDTIRLTGGEPLLYKELNSLIKGIKNIGIAKVNITTNGSLLKGRTASLADAGIDSLNVSLDALDEEAFTRMSRRKNVYQVIEGIDEALRCTISVKINSVIMRHVNDHQILSLLDFAIDRGIVIRFLELMKMGHLYNQHSDYFFSEEEILKVIARNHSFYELNRMESSTANYWMTYNNSVFGIISNTSRPFCHDCTRLRLDSYGNIYGCLSSPLGISVLPSKEKDQPMEVKLRLALAQKKTAFTGSNISMKSIGG